MTVVCASGRLETACFLLGDQGLSRLLRRQLTVQEVSTMIRQGVTPILVILNNDGYVIERKIHGENRVYNEIKDWDWQGLLGVFKPAQGKSASYRVKNRKELESLFANKEFARADKIQ